MRVIRRKFDTHEIVSICCSLWQHEAEDVANHVRDQFISLFTTSMEVGYRRQWDIANWPVKFFDEEALQISSLVTSKEVKDAMRSLKPFKALRLDGLHARFFQCFQLLTGESVIQSVKNVFEEGKVLKHFNKNLIILIPKNLGAYCLGSFRPISLCNTIYKVITKIIVARIRPMLPKLISPMQTAFVPGRKGLDNVIIAQEVLHTMSGKKGRMGSMTIKIDLEKAYDMLKWSFIRDTLLLFNIPAYLINVIMSCITFSSVAVLLNGGVLEQFKPSLGIRQGDPLSPYIFIMCTEVLGFIIRINVIQSFGTQLKPAEVD